MPTMDETELQLMEFFSWEEFCCFFDDWCEKRKTLFFLKSSILLNKSKWALENLQLDVMEALKYNSARLACKHVHISKKKLLVPKNRKGRCSSDEEDSGEPHGCSAYIFLKLSERKNSLVITKCHLQHNHPLCPTEFNYSFQRGLLLANSYLPIRFTNQISKMFVESRDIKYLLSFVNTKANWVFDPLYALDSLFSFDPDAKVKLVFLQDQAIISMVFLVTTEMMAACQYFPRVLFFNKVLSVNEDFDLYSFLCVSNSGKSKDCAYILVRKGATNILRFASVSLVQSVPNIKPRVRCVVVGADIGEEIVVTEIFPQATVQLLRCQVLQTLHSKALEMGVTEDWKLLSLFTCIASSKTLADYNKTVKDLRVYCSDSFIKYFMDQWHTCRKMWVDFWSFDLAHLDTSDIVFQHKQTMSDLLGTNESVAECILHLIAPYSIKKEHQLKENKIVSQYKAVCTPDETSMIEEELSFLRDSKYYVKQNSKGFILDDGVSEFYIDQSLVTCSCTIHSSSLLPCRHIFAARSQNGEELFDLKLLSKSHP